MDDKTRPFLPRIFSPTILVVVPVVLIVLALIFVPGMVMSDEDRIISFGVIFALAGVMFTTALTSYNRLKQYTFDLILKTRFDNTYKANLNLIRITFGDEPVVRIDIANEIFHSKKNEYIDLRNAIGDVLNFYEILAISIWYMDAHEETLREFYKYLLIEDIERLRNFIPIWRGKNKEAFIYVEWLYNEWSEVRLTFD